MSTIKVDRRGKITNPMASKLLVVGIAAIEINLDQPEIVTDKKSFCIVTLAEHYVNNMNKLGNLEDFIKALSDGFTHINIETDKGVILGLNLTPYFLKQIKNAIQGLIVINKVRDGVLTL